MTRKGVVKKTPIDQYKNVRRSGLIAIKLKEGDELCWVKPVKAGQEIVMATKFGKAIRFSEGDARAMGRSAQGVIGMKLKNEDHIVEMDVISDTEAKMLVVMENGLGKITLSAYRNQKRGGSGVKTANLTKKTGNLVGAVVLEGDYEPDLILI